MRALVDLNEPPIRFQVQLPSQPIPPGLDVILPGDIPPTAYDQKVRYLPKVSLVKVDLLRAGTPGVAFTLELPNRPGEWVSPMFFPKHYAFPSRRVTTYHLSKLGIWVPEDLMFPPRSSAQVETTMYNERVDAYVDTLRKDLRRDVKKYFSGLSAVKTELVIGVNTHPNLFPSYIDAPISHQEGIPPTHFFVVRDNALRSGQVFGFHDLVYGLHCTNGPFASFQPDPPMPRSNQGRIPRRDIPVIQLNVLDLNAFSNLRYWMYTHDPISLLEVLTPELPEGKLNADDTRCMDLASKLASKLPLAKTVSHADLIHKMWSVGTQLGVVGNDYWEPIRIAHTIIYETLVLQLEALYGNEPDEENDVKWCPIAIEEIQEYARQNGEMSS